MPIWPESFRAAPNVFLRSALFPAIKPSDRKILTREVLASQNNALIRFTGIQLSQGDLDVWEEAVHIARNNPLGHECQFSANSFLKKLNRNTGKSQHEWLKNSVARLTSANVEITHENRTYGGHLIDEFYRDEITNNYRLVFSKNILTFFDAGYTQFHYDKRKILQGKPLAQWLSYYYSSHGVPYPIKITTLHKLCGSNSSLKEFNRGLKKALDHVVNIGVLKKWEIKDGMVHVNRSGKTILPSK